MLHKSLYTLVSFFPEVYQWDIEKLKMCLKELFCFLDEDLNNIQHILQDFQQLKNLIQMPQVEQRTKEWFDLRENRLTASDLAQALGRGKFGTRKALLQKKAFPDKFTFKTTLPALKWGTMFEEMGIRCYQQKINPVKIHEFGLIPHTTIECFGASPDGITETGIMVEMKCPFARKCDDQIPEQYYIQIQGQLATCGLHFCDYVECYYDTFNDLNEYKILSYDLTTRYHGIILEFMKNNDYFYLYSPEEYTVDQCIQWANKTALECHAQMTFVKMTPWKLKHLFYKQVKFDQEFWTQTVPDIYTFWNDVLELRKKGYEPEEQTSRGITLDLVTPKKYKFIEDSDED
jgi:putative phage-type endonuclease